jgi:hypothetical protein
MINFGPVPSSSVREHQQQVFPSLLGGGPQGAGAGGGILVLKMQLEVLRRGSMRCRREHLPELRSWVSTASVAAQPSWRMSAPPTGGAPPILPTAGAPGIAEAELLLYVPPPELLVERTRREGGGTPS